MPRVKKKQASKSKSGPLRNPAQKSTEPEVPSSEPRAPVVKTNPVKPAQRKRGWRDIEAISERARLKKMLADIWHEDIELDEDIFGDSDHLQGFYTDMEDDEIEAEIEDEIDDEPDEFDEETE